MGQYDRLDTKEIRKREIFERYLTHLGLSEQEIRGATIMDIGASTGAFADVAMDRGAKMVVSIEATRPGNRSDQTKGGNIKLFDTSAEDENLEEKLAGTDAEDKDFDYILAHASFLYTDFVENQDVSGKWTKEIDFLGLQQKAIQVLCYHLGKLKKDGGKMIIFPYFPSQAILNFKGNIKDVSEYNHLIYVAIQQALTDYPKLKFHIEEVKNEGGVKYYRIIFESNLDR